MKEVGGGDRRSPPKARGGVGDGKASPEMEGVGFGPVGRGPKGRFVSIKGNSLLSVPMEINMEVASAPILPSVEISHGSVSPLPVCSSLEIGSDNCCLEETMSMERDGLNGFKGSLDKDCDHVSSSCCKGSGGATTMLNRGDVLGNMVEQNVDYSSKGLWTGIICALFGQVILLAIITIRNNSDREREGGALY